VSSVPPGTGEAHTIPPDNKDWTWVLERSCPECGYDTRSITGPDAPALIRRMAADWDGLLQAGGTVAVRPRPDRWSTLEYGCHVRDVFRLAQFRLGLMLIEDDPAFANWDQNGTAVSNNYSGQDPCAVAGQLDEEADRVALLLQGVQPHQWSRSGRRSDGAVFTVETFARYVVHDPVHHLWDVGAGW
jgi:hypothetical protein